MVDKRIIGRIRQLISPEEEFETAEDVEEFLELLECISKTKEPEYLPYLFEFLRDNWYIGGTDEALRRTIESFQNVDYVQNLLKILQRQYVHAPESFQGLLYGIINTPRCFEALKTNIHLADRETLLKVLQDIEDDEPLPEHVEAINELRKLLNNNGLMHADK